MDLFDFDKLRAERASALRRYIRLRTFTNVFRIIELCLALAVVSWVSVRLPFAVRISGEFCRQTAGLIASPLFVFIVSNSIIATLIAKSGRFRGENPAASNAETDLYEELIKNSEQQLCPKSSSENPKPTPPEDTAYQDKEIVSQVNVATSTCPEEEDGEMSLYSGSDSDSDMGNLSPRVFRRTKSEKLRRRKSTEKGKLRRSETEKCGKTATSAGENQLCPGDELSDEEFQRAVDEFIAKHLRFRRQESLDIVLQMDAGMN
uniref:Uncharacterized protein MANES_02G096700 n=1 Tax=Rhizophora mucronata TaxID=61149 RepID=A0A2P2P2K1_RHIMU